MSPHRLAPVPFPLALALALLAAPAPAHACSCATIRDTDLARCATASRVFAGTIDAYEWPLVYRAAADRSVEIHLAVDTVWRGAVPSRLVVDTDPLGGPGSCTLYPPPGIRFVVCDDQDDAAPPALGFCARPALGQDAELLAAALGPGAAPTVPAASRGPWWTDPIRLADSWQAVLLLLTPFAIAGLGAGAGALARRRRPPAAGPPSVRRFVALLLAAALLVIGARLALHASLPPGRLLLQCLCFGPPVVAAVFGGALAAVAQRRGGRGIAVAILTVAVVLTAGFMRLHTPVQPADAAACSEARAREYLRAAPSSTRHPAHDAWVQGAPRACTDFGLSRLRPHPHGHAVGFADGHGGAYWVRRQPGDVSYVWELP